LAEYFSQPGHVPRARSLYGMLVLPAQNTCCNAAHSALAQVMITADAFGSLPAGVARTLGGLFPTAAKFTTGSAGPSAIEKLADDSAASCKVCPKRALGLWPLLIL
jgi:hypothetical protein